jgi:nitronate monooxygenase
VITGAFAVCPLCATSARHRALRRCVEAVEQLAADVVGSAVVGGRSIDVPPRFGMPPDVSTTGDVVAMAMYAGTGVAAITSVEPVAAVVASLCGGDNTPGRSAEKS